MLRVANFLQRVGADMVICNNKTVRRYERAAASGVEADTGFLQVLEPLGCRLEMVFFFELLERWRIEKPHSFVRRGGCHAADYTHDDKYP